MRAPRRVWPNSPTASVTGPPATAPAAYTPPGTLTAEEVFGQALAHGDEHVIKLTDTALDVGDEQALAAALRSVELSEPSG
ncbi:hypothetical protein GCM10010358_21970 [Streptomyces minutiscleroticus]|uniref:Uncharacterized protein n=1 Tax=Streptomyces minutiscleroticus TaxID=68238 RepID=A0A918KMY2_9ACTN|nr:hypothetical protein GCM10010358_21970 [Streptomyces minutiscleroticus]